MCGSVFHVNQGWEEKGEGRPSILSVDSAQGHENLKSPREDFSSPGDIGCNHDSISVLGVAATTSLAESLVGESGHSGEGLAFEEFEAGTAAGGDVGDAVGEAGLLDGGD